MFSTSTGLTHCWIGLNDIGTEGTFVWVDGSESTYRHWSPGQPDNGGSIEDCVHTYGNPFWNDEGCTETKNCYFCSAHGKSFVDIRLVEESSDTLYLYLLSSPYLLIARGFQFVQGSRLNSLCVRFLLIILLIISYLLPITVQPRLSELVGAD